MRSILNNSSESIVPLFNEIEILHQYIQLEQLRFNHCFTFNVKTPKNIDVEFIGIPAMLIQPYVENAIIHGVAPLKERSGIIQLSFSLEQKYLICIIEDNGVGRGFHHSKAKSLHKPKGMLISQKRLEILNNDFGDTIPIQIEDLMDANGKPIGTKVKLKILYEDLND
jgi:LytS/YehU family sensor histidine kinase